MSDAEELQISAGTICWRKGNNSEIEILTIVRHGYKDISFPKGKKEPGESLELTAFRETFEETNITVRLGQFIGFTSYSFLGVANYGDLPDDERRRRKKRVWRGRRQWVRKQVHYWAATPRVIESFSENNEVKKIAWVKASDMKRLRLYKSDLQIVDKFLNLYSEKTELFHGKTVILLRHAHANGDSLSPAGEVVAQELPSRMVPWGPDRVYSSPKNRCIQTVSAFCAGDIATDSVLVGGYSDNIVNHLRSYPGECILVCTHAPVIAQILRELNMPKTYVAPGEYVVLTL